MKQLKITLAIAEDIPQMVALDKLCFGGIWSAEGYTREIDSPNSSILLLWQTEEQLQRASVLPRSPLELIGIACLWSIVEEAHITLLGIHPDYRRKGFGMLLLVELLQDGINRGLERATLEVKVGNRKALNLYEKFGFKLAGRRKKYYADTGEDALILWLNNLNKSEFKQKIERWRLEISDRIGLSNEQNKSL